MIAIVSPVLAALTVLAVVRIAFAVRYMNETRMSLAETWRVILIAGWIDAVGTTLLAIALMINNPPQAAWAHPLVWLLVCGLVVAGLLAWSAHNIVSNMRHHDAWSRGQFEPHMDDTRR